MLFQTIKPNFVDLSANNKKQYPKQDLIMPIDLLETVPHNMEFITMHVVVRDSNFKFGNSLSRNTPHWHMGPKRNALYGALAFSSARRQNGRDAIF